MRVMSERERRMKAVKAKKHGRLPLENAKLLHALTGASWGSLYKGSRKGTLFPVGWRRLLEWILDAESVHDIDEPLKEYIFHRALQLLGGHAGVADLCNVTERTVREWEAESSMPRHRMVALWDALERMYHSRGC